MDNKLKLSAMQQEHCWSQEMWLWPRIDESRDSQGAGWVENFRDVEKGSDL